MSAKGHIGRDGSLWSELDDVIVRCLQSTPVMSTTQIAHKLGVSEEAASSCLALLSAEGKVRIRVVELGRRPG